MVNSHGKRMKRKCNRYIELKLEADKLKNELINEYYEQYILLEDDQEFEEFFKENILRLL